MNASMAWCRSSRRNTCPHRLQRERQWRLLHCGSGRSCAGRPSKSRSQGTDRVVLFFGAVLRDQGGQQIGKVVGEIVTVDVDVDGASDEDRFRKLAFNFDDGQIIALGSSEYVGSADDQTNFARNNAPVTAVVVGGTDQYQGVSGVVITTKLADGTYEHNFQLQE